ncbi:hypothetical protein GmHk_05G013764 [Glycine max]|nr:hypothetical protein GmHk_05G013764 [Glycine max]
MDIFLGFQWLKQLGPIVTNYGALTIQGYPGMDIFLGFQWLKQLGPIVTNYGALTMKFIHDGASIMLRAGVPSLPEEVSPNRLNSASAFYHRAITTPQPPSTPPPLTHQIPVVASLLQKYTFIFQPPTLLPPPRQITHQIHLLPNTNLVSIRPYWYPHFQKAEIEK